MKNDIVEKPTTILSKVKTKCLKLNLGLVSGGHYHKEGIKCPQISKSADKFKHSLILEAIKDKQLPNNEIFEVAQRIDTTVNSQVRRECGEVMSTSPLTINIDNKCKK